MFYPADVYQFSDIIGLGRVMSGTECYSSWAVDQEVTREENRNPASKQRHVE